MAEIRIAQQADWPWHVTHSELSPGAKHVLTVLYRFASPDGEILVARTKAEFQARLLQLTGLSEIEVRRVLEEATQAGWCRWHTRKCRTRGCPGFGCEHEQRIFQPTYPPGVPMPGVASVGPAPRLDLGMWAAAWIKGEDDAGTNLSEIQD